MLDVISVKDALLAIDTDRPLDLPGLCTGCGVPTDELLKVEVGAGDATTEVKDLALHAVHLVPLRSIHIPCCKRCRSRVRKAKMFALASVASGFAMFALIPFVADHVSVMVASCLAFAGELSGACGRSAHDRKEPYQFNNAPNGMGFVDGHVSYIRIYWNGVKGFDGISAFYEPPAGYDYKWSGN
jgi:hypothetical protein